jgi:hypothetical protein
LRQLALLMCAGVLCASAADHSYTVRVPASSRVEAHVEATADWDVTVTFDPATCEVSCQYRQKARGLHLFLPPVTELRVYRDGVTNPRIYIVDPAGRRLPRLTRVFVPGSDLPFVAGKGLPVCAPQASVQGLAAASQIPRRAAGASIGDRTISLPLRI